MDIKIVSNEASLHDNNGLSARLLCLAMKQRFSIRAMCDPRARIRRTLDGQRLFLSFFLFKSMPLCVIDVLFSLIWRLHGRSGSIWPGMYFIYPSESLGRILSRLFQGKMIFFVFLKFDHIFGASNFCSTKNNFYICWKIHDSGEYYEELFG